jgi:hypothetical protein
MAKEAQTVRMISWPRNVIDSSADQVAAARWPWAALIAGSEEPICPTKSMAWCAWSGRRSGPTYHAIDLDRRNEDSIHSRVVSISLRPWSWTYIFNRPAIGIFLGPKVAAIQFF